MKNLSGFINALYSLDFKLQHQGTSLGDKTLKSLSDVKPGDVIKECRSGRLGVVTEVKPNGIVYDTTYMMTETIIHLFIPIRDIGWTLKISQKSIKEARQ